MVIIMQKDRLAGWQRGHAGGGNKAGNGSHMFIQSHPLLRISFSFFFLRSSFFFLWQTRGGFLILVLRFGTTVLYEVIILTAIGWP